MEQVCLYLVQGDKLNMAFFVLVPCKNLRPVNMCNVAYTGKVTLYKALEKHGHVELATL